MEDTATTSQRSAPRSAGAPRGAPSRGQSVEDFVGALANEAAQALRRVGLKPGLERTFGYEAELVGRVVAQEPQAGAQLARNGLVVLYVAAPRSAREVDDAAEPAALERSEQEQPTRALDRAELASQGAAAPRRRKPGRSRSAPLLDIAPSPRLPDEGEDWPQRAGESGEDASERNSLDGLAASGEDYVIAADALFAGGERSDGRRASGRLIRLRSRLAGSPTLIRVAGALLLLWLLVAGAAALLGHGSSRAHRAPAHAPVRARRTPRAQTVAQPRVAPRKRPPPRRRARPSREPRRAVRVPAVVAPEPAVSAAAPSPPPAATSSPTPTPHHEGGLFSP
ncbi:MAG TPA: PASTA domain-containing protein [Solirubrobacteraceae bacterium]